MNGGIFKLRYFVIWGMLALTTFCSSSPVEVVSREPFLRLPVDGDGRTLDICGVSHKTKLRVELAEFAASIVPVRGEFMPHGACIRFRARFHLAPGSEYRVRIMDGDAASDIPGIRLPSGEMSRVLSVYPTGNVLPENLLRFYIHFSQPMREGEALSHLRLLNAAGREVRGAFLEPVHELWDRDRRRLTVLFDPSRVKTGLVRNERMGRALRQGGEYRLTVLPGWRDAFGNRMVDGFEKRFQAVAADRSAPDAGTWDLSLPAAGSGEALAVRFPESLDHGCLLDFLRVATSDGSRLSGEIRLGEHEKVWMFFPAVAWQPGNYRLMVDRRLEDPAGNNLNGLFDRPVTTEAPPQTNTSRFIELPFKI